MRIVILILLVCFISTITTAQKINIDTLNIDQLNNYKNKAVKLRNAGKILTIGSAGIFTLGAIVSYNMDKNGTGGEFGSAYPLILGTIVGTGAFIVGVPLWTVGRSRMTQAELTLKRFDIAWENQMAVGIGISIKF